MFGWLCCVMCCACPGNGKKAITIPVKPPLTTTPIDMGQYAEKHQNPNRYGTMRPKNIKTPIGTGQCTENQSEMDNPVKAGIRGSMPLYLQS